MRKRHLRAPLPFLAVLLAGTCAQGQDDVTILGTLGGPSSTAYDVAGDAWVVGSADTAGGSSAFVAMPAGGGSYSMQALPKPGGWGTSAARGINAFHQICGWIFSTSGRAMPWVWAGTSLGAQLPLPSGALGGGLYAINDLGQAVGWREHGSLSIIQRPCFWDPVVGPTVIGSYQGEALGINNRGEVVGWTYDDNGSKVAFLWSTSLGFRLLGRNAAWTDVRATGINDRGQIVGWAKLSASVFRAIQWNLDGTYSDAGTIFGGSVSSAYCISERGSIVGSSNSATLPVVAAHKSGENWRSFDERCKVAYGANGVHNPSRIVGSAVVGGFERAFIFSLLNSDPNGVGIGSVSCVRVQLVAGEIIDGSTGFGSGGSLYAQGDAIVRLTSSNPAVASVPSFVTIRDRHNSVRVRIATGNVATPTNVNITATYPAGYRQPDGPLVLQISPAGPYTVRGTVTLGEFVGNPNNEVVAFRILDVSSGNLLHARSSLLAANGDFAFTLPGQGSFTVVAQGRHWLGKAIGPVIVGASGATGVNLSLKNGDVDGDNEVAIGDFARLSEAYQSGPLDPAWDENADLDGDEEVAIGDYAVLSMNYGSLGD